MNPALPTPDFAGPVPLGAARFTGPALAPLSTAHKVLLVLGVVLFDWLFWMEPGGANMLVFTLFIVASQIVLLPRYAAARRSAYFWLGAAGSLFSATMMAVYGSAVSALACMASVLLLLGYVNQPHLRLVLFAGLTALASGLQAGLRLLAGFRPPRNAGAGVRRSWFYGRLLLVPLFILGAFHILFAVANPVYDELAGRVLEALSSWLLRLLPAISLVHVVFFTFGFFVTAGVLVVVPVHFLADHESRLGEFIRRQRDRVASFGVRRPDFRWKTVGPLDLRKEYIAAAAVFGLVNVLLLVVNAIDVRWLWFGFTPTPGFDLAQFVHEGTYVLIFSILLAMGIMLWFFRRNLNFYGPGLPWLRWGATVWVFQNAVLATSVGLRNYYYILHSGVAYKRIGVCFFLLLVFFGLGTVLLKIWQRRSVFSLVRLNSLALYGVLLLLAAGNWEVWIARYNLQPRFRTMDVGFLLSMPGRVLPTLLARRAVLDQVPQLTARGADGAIQVPAADAQRKLDLAISRWLSRYRANPDWQGRTWADHQTYKALQGWRPRAPIAQ